MLTRALNDLFDVEVAVMELDDDADDDAESSRLPVWLWSGPPAVPIVGRVMVELPAAAPAPED